MKLDIAIPLLAATFHGVAYTIYAFQVGGGDSVPNPASWTIWMIVSIINALSFWKGMKSGIATAQFFTGSFGCMVVWVYALHSGSFSPLDATGWIVLGLCVVCIGTWQLFRKATYVSLIVGLILVISGIPTIEGVWENSATEKALPWIIWTVADTITVYNGYRRRQKESEIDWRLMQVVPVVLLLFHGAVAVLSVF